MNERYEVKIYVGAEFDRNNDKLTDVTAKIETARNLLTRMFDAVSIYEHSGAWGSPAVVEKGITFVLVLDSAEVPNVPVAAWQVRDIFNQTCVLVTKTRVESEFI